tara:strand:+ start:565 stop:1572 length:1008 start_codon:yes stop_codon:yes gene_type:complete
VKRILLTGGLGYIGSHTCIALAEHGYTPVVIDNLRNSNIKIKHQIEKINNEKLEFFELDLIDKDKIKSKVKDVSGIIHFAALKSVGESVANPALYYRYNLGCMLSALDLAKYYQVKSFIFSSSATVYGDLEEVEYFEDMSPGEPLNPYAHTKSIGEQMLKLDKANHSKMILRYFNPIGAHKSGEIGELPQGIPNNLVPFITQAAKGKQKKLMVFGDDYNTRDGTCIRDYIHVQDLAYAHAKALDFSIQKQNILECLNVGTGKGKSVLEVIKLFEEVNGIKLNFQIGERRPGDKAAFFANADKIYDIIGWSPKFTVKDALSDAWKWENNWEKLKLQ